MALNNIVSAPCLTPTMRKLLSRTPPGKFPFGEEVPKNHYFVYSSIPLTAMHCVFLFLFPPGTMIQLNNQSRMITVYFPGKKKNTFLRIPLLRLHPPNAQPLFSMVGPPLQMVLNTTQPSGALSPLHHVSHHCCAPSNRPKAIQPKIYFVHFCSKT